MPSGAAAVRREMRVERLATSRAALVSGGGRTPHVHAEGDPTDVLVPRERITPSRRLVAAVVWQALHDVATRAVPAPTWPFSRNAVAWIASNDTAWPYSFVNCCHVLGLEPGAVRAALARRDADAIRAALDCRRART